MIHQEDKVLWRKKTEQGRETGGVHVRMLGQWGWWASPRS